MTTPRESPRSSPDAGKARRYRWGFAALAAGVVVFRLWFAATLPLSGDEAYHWEWSRHPAFGYYDHPGLTAYLIRASTWLFGRSTEFTVRLPAVAMLALAALAVRALTRDTMRRRGADDVVVERAGFLAGFLMLMVPIYGVLGVYISTDPPLLGFWALTLLGATRAVYEGRWRDWILAGLALGCAMVSKFLAFFLLMGLGLAIVGSPDGRRWLKRPHLYVAGACAAAVLAPFLWWNATHGWATFVFNFVYRQQQTGWALFHVPEFVGAQALAVSPGLFVFALMAVGWALRRGQRRDLGIRMLALSAAIPLLYFLWGSTRREIGLHWPAGAWIGAVVLMVCRESGGAVSSPLRRRFWIGALTLCALMTVALHAAVHVPARWMRRDWAYDRSPNRIATGKHIERYGWPELGRFVAEMRDDMLASDPEGSTGVFVLCNQYGLAAQVAFYTPDQMTTHLWAPPRVHGENYRFWDDFAALEGLDAIFVSKSKERAVAARPKLREHFEGLGEVETLPILVSGHEVRRFYVRRCYRFDGRSPVFPDPRRTP